MINQMPKSGKFVFKKNNSAGEGQNLLRDHLGQVAAGCRSVSSLMFLQGKKGAGTAPVEEEDVFFDDIIDVPSEQSQKHAMPPLPPGLGTSQQVCPHLDSAGRSQAWLNRLERKAEQGRRWRRYPLEPQGLWEVLVAQPQDRKQTQVRGLNERDEKRLRG